MKKRIKITKQLLKEDDTEKRSVKRDRTQKFDPPGGPEFQTRDMRLDYVMGSSDPTQQVSREELLAALADAPIAEKGMLQKMKDYLTDKLFSSSPEKEEPVMPQDEPEVMKEPEMSMKKRKIDYPEPAAIPAAADVPRGEGDAMDDPRDPGKDEFDPDMFKLQEIARRHFKKSK